MRIFNKKCLCFLILLCGLGCVSNQNQNAKLKMAVKAWLGTVEIGENSKAIIIIPGSGCGGCISNVEKFVFENCGRNRNVKFVFTEINSLKILNARLGNHSSCKNILIDKNNALKYGLLQDGFYPAIIYLKKQKLVSTVLVNPKNPEALLKLKEFL